MDKKSLTFEAMLGDGLFKVSIGEKDMVVSSDFGELRVENIYVGELQDMISSAMSLWCRGRDGSMLEEKCEECFFPIADDGTCACE